MISATQYRFQAEVNRQTQLSDDIAKLQIDNSTAVRIHASSDDPAAAARVAALRQEQADTAAWSANVRSASATASAADGTMASVANAVTQAQELLIQAGSATLSTSDRASIASQLSGIAADLRGYSARTDASGQPLFPAKALAVPVGRGSAIAATPNAADVFGISTSSGGVDLATLIDGAAANLAGAAPNVGAALATVGAAITQIADARAAQGVRASRIDAAGTRLTNDQTALASERSELESTDIARTVADIQAKLTTLDAAQALLVKVSKSNLFDMIS